MIEFFQFYVDYQVKTLLVKTIKQKQTSVNEMLYKKKMTNSKINLIQKYKIKKMQIATQRKISAQRNILKRFPNMLEILKINLSTDQKQMTIKLKQSLNYFSQLLKSNLVVLTLSRSLLKP